MQFETGSYPDLFEWAQSNYISTTYVKQTTSLAGSEDQMERESENLITNLSSKIDIELTKKNVSDFSKYTKLLIEWNKKINKQLQDTKKQKNESRKDTLCLISNILTFYSTKNY